MKFLYFLKVFIIAVFVVAGIMGGLISLLIVYSDYTAAHPKDGKPAHIECPEGRNSYMCIVRSYLRPVPELE